MENIRRCLNNTAALEAFDALVEGRALGASSNIRSIILFTEEILKNGFSLDEMKAVLSAMFEYFDALRGDSSIAVRNAIENLRTGVDRYSSIEELRTGCSENCKRVAQKIKSDNDKIIAAAVEVLKGAKRLFLFDYSSTVDAIASALFTLDPTMELEVAESRILNGGVPFVKSAIERGQKVNFITDAAMAGTVKESDAVLIGAETIYKEGSVINTPGSELAAFCAQRANVNFYVATSYLKYDKRGQKMFKKKDIIDSFDRILSPLLKEGQALVTYKSHGYALVPSDCITGYFTEKGYIAATRFLETDGEWRV